MTTQRNASTRAVVMTRASGLKAAIAALLALSCVAGTPRPAHADPGGFREHEFREHEFRHEEFRDARFHHDHYYPPRGYRFTVLPPHPRVIVHGGQQFYFAGGVWYRPVANTYVVVRPPVGIVVPVLPAYYTRVWVGPYPYYYANDVYYVRNAQGYVVVDQPAGTIAMAPPAGTPLPPDDAVTELGPVQNGVPPSAQVTTAPQVSSDPPPTTVAQASGSQLFIYPRQNQTTDQLNRDRGECNNWSIGQTGRNPASSGGQMDPDFQRAMSACLEARGYTVK